MTDKAPQKDIETLSELLKFSGSQYRLYDIGRLVSKLPKEKFEKVELNQLPYPTPVQGHACIAIAFWQKQSSQPYLWLLKLPLDERGLLNQGARNHFIAIIIEALGEDLTQETTKKQEELLSSNPYLFTPAQYKLASLNSKIKVDLKQAPSEYLSHFNDYLSQDIAWENWHNVGVQGITDFVARIKQDNNEELLAKSLPYLPPEVLSPVCSALENEQFSITLITALINEFNSALTSQEARAPLLLRALAANSDHIHVKDTISQLLIQPEVSTDLLITLSSRCWLALAEQNNLNDYFEQLLKNREIELFPSIFKDLVALPAVRAIAFQCIRSEHRSPALAQAVGQLFSQA
ncbi:MAG: DUF3549 family protein [Colwellia sp.]|nr:DUF3549 family protein [Colwellia sp.]